MHPADGMDRPRSWRALPGLEALADQADAFLIDQFGTLHNGARAYPGAVEGLACLRRAGARLALLSNSGKRAAPNLARLGELGFPPGSFDAFLSSGELAWRILAAEARPRACLLLSRGDDREFLDGLGFRLVEDAAAAELVLITGSEADRVPLDDIVARLAPAAARKIPAVCTNPDRLMVLRGQPAPGSGEIAARYAALGAPVTWIGKPYGAIYDAARTMLGLGAGARMIAIGDSLEHDIAGGRQAGCGTALVRTGLAARLDDAALAAEPPDFVLDRFAP